VRLVDVVVGAAIVLWAATFRRVFRRARNRIAQRGGDTTPMDRLLSARWLLPSLALVAVGGIAIIVLGVTGSQ
jgi:hypothetical protein